MQTSQYIALNRSNLAKPRVTISTLQSFMDLLRRYPSLLNLSSFAPIVSLFKRMDTKPKPSAGCGGCGKRKQLTGNRALFESCLTSLSEEEKMKIKGVLNTREVCYYTVNADNQLKLVCF